MVPPALSNNDMSSREEEEEEDKGVPPSRSTLGVAGPIRPKCGATHQFTATQRAHPPRADWPRTANDQHGAQKPPP